MTILRNIAQLATCQADSDQDDAGLISQAALVFKNDTIVWVGHEADIPDRYYEEDSIDCGQRLIVPGLID